MQDIKHIIRCIILLIILFIVLIIGKTFLTPKSFGQYGNYRGDSVKRISEIPVKFKGSDSCSSAECHKDNYKTWQEGIHSVVNCETCHGPGNAHTQNPENVDMVIPEEPCLVCHQKITGRPGDFPQVEPKSHYGDKNKSCVECHNAHSPIIENEKGSQSK